MRRWISLVPVAFLTLVGVACGSGAEPLPQHASGSPSVTRTTEPPAVATETPDVPKELKVAFINLLSPLALDAENREADETNEARLQALITELKAFDPDIVGFNEASWTRAHGSAVSRLQKELKMEAQYLRANPQFPLATSREDAEELVKKAGFEEGELILVKGSRFPILRSTPHLLNPKTSESGEVRAALHVVVKGPAGVGEIDIFITHLTGGGDAVRQSQAANFAVWVRTNRGRGPAIVMVGQSDPTATPSYELFKNVGLTDVFGTKPIVTCCRTSVIGEQPPVTARSDYLMTSKWFPESTRVFGDEPVLMADGRKLYISDHNGLMATFLLPQPAAGGE
jgi:hypothetical protein